MSRSPVALSPTTVAPRETGPSRGAARRGAWLAALRGQIPVIVVAVVIVVLWYGAGLYSDYPFARQIAAPGASFGQVLRSALNLPSPFVPLPHQVLNDFFTALAQPFDSPRGLWIHMAATGVEALLGLLIGAAVGVFIATVFVYSRLLENAVLPYVVASQTVPVLALAPIVIGIFGITLTAKVVVAAYLAFFSVTVSAVKGFKSADPLARELMRSYAASRWQIYRKLLFPVALPYLFTGLKIGATASLVGAILAELPFGSATGLGARLLIATTYDETIAWWSTMLAASVLGIIAFGAISGLERLVVKGRPAPMGG